VVVFYSWVWFNFCWCCVMKGRVGSLLKRIVSFLVANGACEVKLFGSYARGQQRKGSDVDLLVEFKGRKSLLEVVGLENRLAEKFGIKIELLSEEALSPYLRESVLKEAKVLL